MGDKELKEFWEWCGFTYKEGRYENWWDSPDGKESFRDCPPAIDLNNLFKYAVPKLPKGKDAIYFAHPIDSERYYCLILDEDGEMVGDSPAEEDPAQALYKAIQGVRNAN